MGKQDQRHKVSGQVSAVNQYDSHAHHIFVVLESWGRVLPPKQYSGCSGTHPSHIGKSQRVSGFLQNLPAVQ